MRDPQTEEQGVKRIYEVEVYFSHPRYSGECQTRKYWVESASVARAIRLGERLAGKEYQVSGAHTPRVQRVEEQGAVDAR